MSRLVKHEEALRARASCRDCGWRFGPRVAPLTARRAAAAHAREHGHFAEFHEERTVVYSPTNAPYRTEAVTR